MAYRREVFTLSETTPAAASTVISAKVFAGLLEYDDFVIEADLVGATGGTLDIFLQRQVADAAHVAGGVWADWLHFAQLAADAAAIRYAVPIGPYANGGGAVIRTIGLGTDASAGGLVLAAGNVVGGHPGNILRPVYVAGAATSAGAAIKIYLQGWRQK